MPKPMRHFDIEQLQRAIQALEDKAEHYIEDLLAAGPPQFQGEMAQYYADQEYDSLTRMSVAEAAEQMFPLYEWLIGAMFARVRDISVKSLDYTVRRSLREDDYKRDDESYIDDFSTFHD